jgi:hypothetical protein
MEGQLDQIGEYEDALSGMTRVGDSATRTIIDLTGAMGDVNQLSRSSASTPASLMANEDFVGYASGGILEGGSGTKDDLYLGTVNGRAQIAMGGEHIMPPAQTKKYATELELMRADKYALGGFVTPYTDFYKGDTSGNYHSTSDKTVETREDYDSVISLLDKVNDMFGQDMPDYVDAIRQINNSYDETIDQLGELSASAADVQFAEAGRTEELRRVEEERKESLTGLLQPMRETIWGMSDMEQSLYDLSQEYSEAREQAMELGASAYDLRVLSNAQAIETAAIEQERADTLYDMLLPMRKTVWAMQDMDLWMYELSDRYAEAIEQARELGASEYELRIIRNAQTQEIQNQITSIMDSVSDIIDQDTLSELEYESKKINEKFDEMRASLLTLGATTADLTTLEEARRIELENVSGVEPVNYYDDLVSRGARVSTFGSQDAFGSLNNEVSVTVLVDGNGIINEGELESKIVDVSDHNSYSKARRDYEGQVTHSGVI